MESGLVMQQFFSINSSKLIAVHAVFSMPIDPFNAFLKSNSIF
jgi:hypothetical protein